MFLTLGKVPLVVVATLLVCGLSARLAITFFYFFILFSFSSFYFIFYSVPISCSSLFSMRSSVNILFMLLGNKVDLFVLHIFCLAMYSTNRFQNYSYIFCCKQILFEPTNNSCSTATKISFE